MRKKIAAGNWKMNTNYSEAIELANKICKSSRHKDVLTILGVPAIHLQSVSVVCRDAEGVEVSAQNHHQEEKGAFTGEISVGMLKSYGLKYVILGHSERREYFGETDEILTKKLQRCYDAGLTPIFCCGEPLEIRKAGTHIEYVIAQLENSIFKFEKDIATSIIAYEPIWAIGTGETASPAQAEEMHAALRKAIANKFGTEVAEGISILYGGSVNAGNASELFGSPNVDGGLVGGASLKADDFLHIINALGEA
jgi:triosephosphate isomerase (TIM)